MDFVAALEQQIHRTGAGGGGGGGYGDEFMPNNNNNNTNAMDNNNLVNNAVTDANLSPKELRKFDSKKRWKNWGWKYSPGKTSSIEEEPPSTEVASSTPSAKTSRHSSPNSSPKHKKPADKESNTAATVVSQLLNQSPLRRRPHSGQTSIMAAAAAATAQSSGHRSTNGKQFTNAINQTATNANRNDIRSSAGARLCQQFENSDDDAIIDELQALLINGRPASVHIVPMSSTQLQ